MPHKRFKSIDLTHLLNTLHNMKNKKAPGSCMNCGSGRALYVNNICQPDFNPRSLVSRELADLFEKKWNGVCEVCGLYQDFIRFDHKQMMQWCQQMISKDQTVSEEAFHTYPVPAEYIDTFEKKFFDKRTKKWAEYFSAIGFVPKNSLFIRPFFGAGPNWLVDNYSAEVAGIEISTICQKTVIDRVPNYKPLNGQAHGFFEGEWLDSGPYDAIFVFHTLCHSCDVHEMCHRLASLVSPGGVIVFSHEVNRKPANPFHTLYMSEWTFLGLLNQHFRQVDRIDNCDDILAHVGPYTLKNDNPDFAVRC